MITVLQDLFDILKFLNVIGLFRILYYIYLQAFLNKKIEVGAAMAVSHFLGRITCVTARVTGQALIGNCASPLAYGRVSHRPR